jgi:hypothetical protein
VPAGHDLDAQPQRPGELTVTVVVALERAARRSVAWGAASERLPADLWLTIAIEAQRCLSLASELIGVPAEQLADELDRTAAQSKETGDGHPALARLRAYAEALREGRGADAETVVPASLPLNPGVHVAAAWAAQAGRMGATVEQWASDASNSLPPGRAAWEAASAAEGQPLAEWTLAQAARRWRSASTSAQCDMWT